MTAPLLPSFTNLDPIVQSQFAGSAQTKLVQPVQPAQPLLPQPILDSPKKDDEFAEFTDFQTATNNLNSNVLVSNDSGAINNIHSTVKASDHEKQMKSEIFDASKKNATDNDDPYASLRQLDPPHSSDLDSVQLRPITNSISDNNFVFHNVNELGATHKVERVQKVFGEKNISTYPQNWSKTNTSDIHLLNQLHSLNDNGSRISTDTSLPVALNDLENDNLTKFALGQTSFDSPDSGSLHSKEPSLHSLDLKSVLTIDSNEDVKEIDNGL